jgi:hypothetical protein
MKKSISIIFASALALSTVFVGCKKDIEEDPDAMYIEGARINFTAQIVSGENATKSTAGLADVHVTLSGAGATQESHTDASGFATFTDLEEGTYSMQATAAGYTTLTAVVEVSSASGNDNSNASGQFTLFNMSGTITGVVYMNMDATNDTTCVPGPNPSSNMNSCIPDMAPTAVTVTARPDGGFDWSDWNNGSANLSIQDLSYEGMNSTATLDANGAYSLTVAGTASGLGYDVYFPTYAFTQTIWDPADATKKKTRREVVSDNTQNFWVVSGVTYVYDQDY